MTTESVWRDVPTTAQHGFLAAPDWQSPRLAIYCAEPNRPGYDSMPAHEFKDEPATLRAKVCVLARLIRESSAFLAYTGAGISTASGISDYASKAKGSLALAAVRRKKTGFDAEPTLAHRVLAQCARAGLLKQWVQQNHDGLPQKAGVPQHLLNEIHGAWFDPSNPVVPMSGSLRDDLCERLVEWEERADLVLAMGTSLCGMNADRVVATASRKAAESPARSLGAVVVGLQRTPYDAGAALRLFARCDEVCALLARELGLAAAAKKAPPAGVPARAQVRRDVFRVPYDARGRPSAGDEATLWDLSPGAKVVVTQGPGKGYRGKVLGRTAAGHYRISLPLQREGHSDRGKVRTVYVLGSWWVEDAVRGAAPRLPVANVRALKA